MGTAVDVAELTYGHSLAWYCNIICAGRCSGACICACTCSMTRSATGVDGGARFAARGSARLPAWKHCCSTAVHSHVLVPRQLPFSYVRIPNTAAVACPILADFDPHSSSVNLSHPLQSSFPTDTASARSAGGQIGSRSVALIVPRERVSG